MRLPWLSGTLCLSTVVLFAGCPSSQPYQIPEEFSPPPGTEPLDTNPRAAQTLAQVSNRLSNGAYFQQTAVSTSGGGGVTNIEQPSSDWVYQNLYVGGGSSLDYEWSNDWDDEPPPPGGGDDPPDTRGNSTYAGIVQGTNYEGVIDCCEATWTVSESAAIVFDEGQNLTQVFLPGFALLPDAMLWVAAPGDTHEYSGVITTNPPINWAYHVTTRSVTHADDTYVVIFDLRVDAESGALTESGSAVHRVEARRADGRVQWSSATDYQIHMLAVAPGQPDVSVDTFQHWNLNGSLTPR